MGKYVINWSKNGQYYFNLNASNGQALVTSETYISKQSCKDGIQSLRLNSQTDERYKKYKNK